MSFKKTSIATFVGAALATGALSASASDINNAISYKSAENLIASTKKQYDNTVTKSGMRNQFDAQLGQTTFQWAGKNTVLVNIGAISAEHQNTYAADFYLEQLTGLTSAKQSLAKPVLANIHDTGRGAKIAKYKQEIAGVEVFNREYNIMMDREFNLVASSGYLVSNNAVKSVSSFLKGKEDAFGDAANSISAAYAAMGGDSKSVTLTTKSSSNKYEKFAVTNTSTNKVLLGEPRAKKVFFEHKNKLVASHYVEVETGAIDSRNSEYFGYVVAAKTGEVLFKKNLTSHAADFNYRVYADAESKKPWDSPHGEVMPAPAGQDVDAYLTTEYMEAPLVMLSHGPISTMDPWLADDATMSTGNNVNAYVDAIAPQGLTNGDYMAEVTSANTFDYKYDDTEAEYSVNNRKAAIVNLFYMNNYLHDDYYDHGFDEMSYNAQESNFGRGGEEGDPLNVEVQDNSGFDNANMSTPADGGSPRMQMFLWDTTSAVNGVDYGVTSTSHSEIGLLPNVGFSVFGPEVFNITGDLVRLEDSTAHVNDGCESAVNATDLVGKIAVIDRGSCGFVDKVNSAQAAGAIGVLIANNKDGDDTFTMGGADAEITIPSMMISQDAGVAIYAVLDSNETVTIDMFKNNLTRAFKDSSWDNAIVAHEWGHYISNRLVGNGSGLSSLQARAMGEGFGDFHALLLTTDEADNLVLGNEGYAGGHGAITYVSSFTNGIRPFPYSTDMEINPLTFEDVGLYPELVHSPGSIWANMLWESTVAMINDKRHTYAEAKNLMKDYLLAGYKMMPMAPTYTEARDAILSAAYANNPEDYKLILAAFAKRGMGLGAISPSRFDLTHGGVIESYKTELDTFTVTEHTINANYEGLMTGYCSNDNILDKGETGTVSFTIKNGGNAGLTGVTGTVVVESGHDVTFADDGVVVLGDVAIFGTATSSPVEFTLNGASTGDELVLKFVPDLEDGMEASEYLLATTVNVDFVKRELVGTSQYEDLNTLSRLNDFTETVLQGGDMATGTFFLDQWDADDGLIAATGHSFTSDVAYQTRTMSVGFDGDYSIEFWHLYNMESGYDGAVVEVRVNGGDWADVESMGAVFEGDGYTDTGLEFTEAAIAGRDMFSGVNSGWETINFGESLNGNQVQFRFRIATDSAYVPDPISGFAAGWYIDDITFTNIQTSIFTDVIAGDTNACDNRLPTVNVSDDQRVKEGTSVNMTAEGIDPNDDALTYTWTQVSGTAVTLTAADTAAVSFTAPEQSAGSETLVFNVEVNDGTGSANGKVSITVDDVPTPSPAVTPKIKSSGSTGLIALLLLPLALFRRRK
ncbi:rhombosortase-dependent M36 family metallopeptidase [Colwellia sp. PAMC 21821]|uniref:rhombosortase-dependent M36 family metallopeptidase n=1 Tax=Colwellia sp. PAMC 21821 TaxID=1816219 RepID=UPI0009BFED1F|nr:rhombosortase-dependent M36 family metallopeptidase [Colwellia sp. PAMC 21821]ARD44722.1 peptidase M36 [Colwellia sp. PAMC 21821]